jgi:hypothetical protein
MPAPTDTHPSAPTRTYSLSEIALILCGDNGTAEQYWVAQRLRGNAQPHLPGFKVQRRWRMTEADLDAAIEALRPRRNELRIPAMTSMTARSQRRLAV